MSIGRGVILAVAFQKVDAAPHAKAAAQGDDQGLQYVDGTVEELHKSYFLSFCRLQDIFLRAHIGQRVIFHALGKVDGVQDFDAVGFIDDPAVPVPHRLSVLVQLRRAVQEHFPRFLQKLPFRKRFVNTENDNSLKNELFLWCTALEIACCHFLTD